MDNVNIELTKEEAIVFFDFITRFNEMDEYDFEDQAEQRVMWNIECILERTLAEPFSVNYPEILDNARKNVRDLVEEGSDSV